MNPIMRASLTALMLAEAERLSKATGKATEAVEGLKDALAKMPPPDSEPVDPWSFVPALVYPVEIPPSPPKWREQRHKQATRDLNRRGRR